MQRLRNIIFLVISLLCIDSARAQLDDFNKSLIDSISDLLGRIDERTAARQKHLTELKAQYHTTSGRPKIESAGQIAAAYLSTDIDSAAQYYRLAVLEARRHGMRDTMDIFQYKYRSLMPAIGIGKEAIEWFEDIDTEGMPAYMRRQHWLTGSQIYYTSYIQYPQGNHKRRYLLKARMAIDSLKQYYPVSSSISQYIEAMTYLLYDDPNMAAANFINALPGLEKYNELTDNALLNIAAYYKGKPEYYQAYMRYLLQRVIKTLNRGVVRPDALVALANELKNAGLSSLADKCYKLALSTEDHSYLKVYDHYNRNDLWKMQYNQSQKSLLLVFLVASVILLLLIIAIIMVIHERKKTAGKAAELKEANDVISSTAHDAQLVNNNLKELLFLKAEQMREYNLFVLRKLKAGQSKSLYEEVETGKYQSRVLSRYLQVFDSKFLKTYPDFIEKLNTLLQPDKQLKLTSDNRLTPELRIAAFIRLGVTDSTRIADALNLSLNTIYTYRNRLRSRAIDRENFDTLLLKTI